jgi:protein SCO1/2
MFRRASAFSSRFRLSSSADCLKSVKVSFSSNAPRNNFQARGPVTFISLGIMLAAGGSLLFYYNLEKEKQTQKVASDVTSVGKAALGGVPWVLVDEDGHLRTDSDFKGKFTLLYFGFTYCPDICPSELVKIGNIIKGLEKDHEGKLVPVFISVDPNRDTVGQIRHYKQDFIKNIIYLTGTKDQVAVATKAYRVYFSKANEQEDDEDDYLVDHSIVLYLISPDGEFLDFFTQRMTVKDVVAKMDKYMKDPKFASSLKK